MIGKADIPFYEECKFGYYEWFARKNGKGIVIKKLAMLSSDKRIISDKSYELEIKYSPEFKNKDEYLNRMEAYEIVRRCWQPEDKLTNHLKYLIIKELDEIVTTNVKRNKLSKNAKDNTQISLFDI